MAELDQILKLDATAIEALNYESARELLDEVVTALDDSSLPLGSLMKLWETGELIAKVCQKHLQDAATKLDDFPEANQ